MTRLIHDYEIEQRAQSNARSEALRQLQAERAAEQQANAQAEAEKARAFNAAVATARAALAMLEAEHAESDRLATQIGVLAAQLSSQVAAIRAKQVEAMQLTYFPGRLVGMDEAAVERTVGVRDAGAMANATNDPSGRWARFIVRLIANGHIRIGDDGRGWVQSGTNRTGYQL
jgi:multidrug efflux pump subunit AcrA (membrane-fusion protein)